MTGVKAGRAIAALVAAATLAMGTAATAGAITPKRGSVTLEPMRVPDPRGGAPWGVRTFVVGPDTCGQIGRIVDGRLGTIDQLGRFTPMPYRYRWEDCAPTKGGPASAPMSYGFEGVATNAPADCTFTGLSPFGPKPICGLGSERTVFKGFFGSDLVMGTFDEGDGSGPRALAIGPRGDFLMVRLEGVTHLTVPRIALYFDSGCTKLGRQRLKMRSAVRRGCTVIVRDLLGPPENYAPPAFAHVPAVPETHR